jgi:hypothetical protein
MNFGIPKQRGVGKKEFHANIPVMRMTAAGEKGTARKFVFNSKAAEMLGLDKEIEGNHYVSISFDSGLYIANTTGMEVEQYRVTTGKPHSFSNKKLYQYILKNIEGLSEDVTNDFVLSNAPNVESSVDVYSLSLLQAGEEYTEQVVIEEPNAEQVSNIEESNEDADFEDIPQVDGSTLEEEEEKLESTDVQWD